MGDSAPYAAMLALGAAIFIVAMGWLWGALCAALYLGYAGLSVCFVATRVCVHCRGYGSRACASGYGLLSARLATRGSPALFGAAFRQYIPAVYPVWAAPFIAGTAVLLLHFSLPLLALIAAFAADSFAALPYLSARYGCARCPQRKDCPWGQKRARH